MTRLLLGVDIGHSTVRCWAFDPQAEPVAFASIPNPAMRTGDGGIAFEALWDAVCLVLRETAERIGEARLRHVDGVAVGGIGCRAVLLDADLLPFSIEEAGVPALYEEYARTMGAEEFSRITGYPFEAGNLGFRLAWLREREPQRLASVASVLSVSDWINYRLTGRLIREPSTAASMGTWDGERDGPWLRLLEALGLSETVMGEVQASGSFVGEIGPAVGAVTGLPAGTPVFLGGHDYLCAALAAGCIRQEDRFNITGTFDIVASFHADRARYEAQRRIMHDYHVVPGLYSSMAESLSGPVLDWHASRAGTSSVALFAELDDLPAPYTETREVVLPQPFGSSFPMGDTDARAVFTGLSCASDHLSTFRAVLEGICFTAREMLEAVGGEGPVRTVGGGTRSSYWMQLKADIFGAPVHVPRVEEATALGAALLAGIGAGIYSSAEEAAAIVAERGADVYYPDASRHDLYDAVYREVFLPLSRAVAEVDRRMAEIGLRARTKGGKAGGAVFSEVSSRTQ